MTLQQSVALGSVRIQVDRISLLTLQTEIRDDNHTEIAFGHLTGLDHPVKHLHFAKPNSLSTSVDAAPDLGSLTLAAASGRFGENPAKKMARNK